MNAPLDVAYYYPAPHWTTNNGDQIKSLLLFFDRIAILLPNYMYGQHAAGQEWLVGPLEEQNLLMILEPNEWIDADTTSQLADIVIGLLASGAFDDLSPNVPFRELSQSRLGSGTDVELATWVIDELIAKDLARPSPDPRWVPLHPVVRTTILVVLSQLARSVGRARGLTLHPTTWNPAEAESLIDTLSLPKSASAGHVVTLDLDPVGIDLGAVPLDAVLEFRAEHGSKYTAYMRDVHGLAARLALAADAVERETLRAERIENLAIAARDLRTLASTSLSVDAATIAIGITGAAWDVKQNDKFGLALLGVGLVVAALASDPPHADAYSYVVTAGKDFL